MATIENAKLTSEDSNQKSVSASAFNQVEFEKVTAYDNSSRLDTDVLSQFKSNLSQVESLNNRLRFVLGEIQHLIKKY